MRYLLTMKNNKFSDKNIKNKNIKIGDEKL